MFEAKFYQGQLSRPRPQSPDEAVRPWSKVVEEPLSDCRELRFDRTPSSNLSISAVIHDVPEGRPLPWRVLDGPGQTFAKPLRIPRIFLSLFSCRQEVPPREPTQRSLWVDSAYDPMFSGNRALPRLAD